MSPPVYGQFSIEKWKFASRPHLQFSPLIKEIALQMRESLHHKTVTYHKPVHHVMHISNPTCAIESSVPSQITAQAIGWSSFPGLLLFISQIVVCICTHLQLWLSSNKWYRQHSWKLQLEPRNAWTSWNWCWLRDENHPPLSNWHLNLDSETKDFLSPNYI